MHFTGFVTRAGWTGKGGSAWAVPLAIAALLSPLGGLHGALQAQPRDLTGMCLDNLDDGCMPRYLPFQGLSVDFCEETCQLENPVDLRDLDGRLYDMTCLADYPDPPGGRVLILSQTDHQGRSRLWFIDRHETREIVPCPRG